MKRFLVFLLGVLLAALPALPSASGGYEQVAERSAVVASAALPDQYRPQNAQAPPFLYEREPLPWNVREWSPILDNPRNFYDFSATDQFALFTLPGGIYQTHKTLVDLLSDGNTAAWYQPGVGVTGTLNASLWANWVNGTAGTAADLAQVTGANQPIYLPHVGSNYAYLPAVAANTLTSPNQTVTGNQTITFDIAPNDYTPAADVTLFTKTSGNDGFIVKWLTTDKIRLVVGDGVSLTNVDVVASSGFTDGSRHTATIAWEDGVGATFSYDGVQSGNQVPAAKTLTNAAVDMTVGSTTSIGKVYRMQVGSLYDMNAALSAEAATNGATFTGGASEIWTLVNTGATPAQIVGSPQFLFNGVAHTLQSAVFPLIQPEIIIAVVKIISWVQNGHLFEGITDGSGSIYQTIISPSISMYAGVPDTGPAIDFPFGVYSILTSVLNGASSSYQLNNGTLVAGSIGVDNMNGFTIGARTGGTTGFINAQVKEVIIRSAADSAATRLAIQQRLADKHGLTLTYADNWLMPRYAWLPAANDDEYLLRANR